LFETLQNDLTSHFASCDIDKVLHKYGDYVFLFIDFKVTWYVAVELEIQNAKTINLIIFNVKFHEIVDVHPY